MLIVVVISVNVYPFFFLAFFDLTCHIEYMGIVLGTFSGCTVLPDSKEIWV